MSDQPVTFNTMEIAILMAIVQRQHEPNGEMEFLMNQNFQKFQEARARLEHMGLISPDGPALTQKGNDLVHKGTLA